MKRVCLYARVSTLKGQTCETQLLALRTYCEARGLEIVHEYCDTGISGAKDRRPQLDALMKAAHARTFDGVVCFKFDRFGRSTSHLLRSLETFQSLGIDFVSMSDSIDSSTPSGKLMFTMLSAFAEFERGVITERINAGLDRARRKGTRLGRREVIVSKDKVADYRQEGRSYDWIAKQLGVSIGKVHAIAKTA